MHPRSGLRSGTGRNRISLRRQIALGRIAGPFCAGRVISLRVSFSVPFLARGVQLVAGFLGAVLLTNWAADRSGLTLVHFAGGETRAELLRAYHRIAGGEDVLIIGSSRVQSGVIAQEAGPALQRLLGRPVRFYQLGVAGLRPTLLADVLDSTLAGRPPRQLLVIAVEDRFFCRPEGQSGEWSLDDGRGSHTWWLRGVAAIFDLPRFLDPAAQESARQIAERGGDRFTPEQLEERLRRAGMTRQGREDVFDLAEGLKWRWTEPTEPDARGWRRCLDSLEALDCQVLFVKMPVQPGFDERYMPEMQKRFDAEILADIAARGWEYVPLVGDPWPTAPGLFISQTHLDFDGARLTTRLFVERILAPRLR
jgi:hypothetical protein